jgi:RNA polymerase sigma factor (sigma-70 family)
MAALAAFPRRRFGLADLVARARDGDGSAWAALVARYRGRVTRTARSYGLGAHEVDDVVQETWLRLFRSLGSLRQPEALGAWLETTARREALRLIGSTRRELLLDDDAPFDGVAEEDPGRELVQEERRAAVSRAMQRLPTRHRRLMTSLLSDAPPSYAELSAQLGIPLGSIGPTRGRCIERLQSEVALLDLT